MRLKARSSIRTCCYLHVRLFVTVDARMGLGNTLEGLRRPQGCLQPANSKNQSVIDQTDLETGETDVELVLDRKKASEHPPERSVGRMHAKDLLGPARPPRIAGNPAGRTPNSKVEGMRRE